MEDHHLPKIACMENYPLATDSGTPAKCCKGCHKNSLMTCHVDHLCWSDMAADHDARHHLIFKAVSEFEEDKKT